MSAATPSTPTGKPANGAAKTNDLEIKDAHLIFQSAWDELEENVGRENLRFPKEIILLGGAPGAGKGTNTAFIAKARGLTCPPVVISALLDSPEAKRLKDAGAMVGDREVISLLLTELMKPAYRDGVILDGFPRTRVQVECLKMLVDKMHQLRREFFGTPLGMHFRQPTIHIMVLFVDEKESIARQLKRGREAHEANEKASREGLPPPFEVRKTDLSEEAARNRYRVFKERTYEPLQSLRTIFHYHFINAQGTLPEVQARIIKELQYQSSLELSEESHDLISP
ncbi:MAG: nucleoside monophosphate kinase, partial [Cephaloticoccus sp.]